MPLRARCTGLVDNYRDRLPADVGNRIVSLGVALACP
jgi:hypothetical protein